MFHSIYKTPGWMRGEILILFYFFPHLKAMCVQVTPPACQVAVSILGLSARGMPAPQAHTSAFASLCSNTGFLFHSGLCSYSSPMNHGFSCFQCSTDGVPCIWDPLPSPPTYLNPPILCPASPQYSPQLSDGRSFLLSSNACHSCWLCWLFGPVISHFYFVVCSIISTF